MTLLVRDEADVLDAQLAFHLNMGVDFFLAMDHESRDGTSELLESYARAGVLRRLPVEGRFREQEWRTTLARAAAEEGADWVVNSDADQFWWPRTGTLRDALAAVPASYGIVRCWDRVFVPTPDDGRHFAERMTFRLLSHEPLHVPWSTYRPLPRVVHRGDPGISVARGSHRVWSTKLALLPSMSPVETLHFPWRSADQMRRKARVMSDAFLGETRRPGGYHEVAELALSKGTLDEHYGSLALGPVDLAHGLETGCLVEDTRVRDVLREVAGTSPLPRAAAFPVGGSVAGGRVRAPKETLRARTELALETVAADEAEIVRLQRRLDELVLRAGPSAT